MATSITCKSPATQKAIASNLKVFPLRLHPGEEILSALLKFVKDNGISAGFIMTCCGSVTKATLRYAQLLESKINRIQTLNEHYEIVSLVGTLAENGGHHLHISLADGKGHMIGGHVIGDLIVFTTAEIVIGQCTDVEFTRPYDSETGFDELKVQAKDTA